MGLSKLLIELVRGNIPKEYNKWHMPRWS